MRQDDQCPFGRSRQRKGWQRRCVAGALDDECAESNVLSLCRSELDQGDGHAVRLDLALTHRADFGLADAGGQEAEGAS